MLVGSFAAIFSSGFPLLTHPLSLFTTYGPGDPCQYANARISAHLTDISFLLKTNITPPPTPCRRTENKTHFLLDGLGILRHVSVTATHTSSPGINVYEE